MPAEPRRNSRKISTDDEIELKRARGEVSCAECRRCVPPVLHADPQKELMRPPRTAA